MTGFLLCIGLGYSAHAFAQHARLRGWRVAGTTRDPDKARRIADGGIEGLVFDGVTPSAEVRQCLAKADALLISAAPDEDGDPFLRCHRNDLDPDRLLWIGYFSTIGVYGDSRGAWIDESAPRTPTNTRAQWRVRAEDEWMRLAEDLACPLDILRLAGIYGPGRNPLRRLKAGKSRAIVKPGQVFNRIHVDDIAAATYAAMTSQASGVRGFNVCDDEPAPPQEVIWHAADLAGFKRPPSVDFETADMTPMARSFYSDCKRVRNNRMKRELGIALTYPTYREGLGALWASGDADT